MKNREVHTEIVLCDVCKGAGDVDKRVSAYDTEIVKCDTCNGKGRLIKITTTEYISLEL